MQTEQLEKGTPLIDEGTTIVVKVEYSEFVNGNVPFIDDFKEKKIIPAKLDGEGEIIEEEKTEMVDISTITGADTKGNILKYVLLSDKRIAKVREGKGSDVEKATMEANGDNSKYLTSMMAATISINGKGINMFDLSKMKMKDYMNLQVAFSEVNF